VADLYYMAIVSDRGWLVSYQPLKLEARLQITMHSRCWRISIFEYRLIASFRQIASAILHTPSPGASTAKESGSEVRFRGVVSAERYVTLVDGCRDIVSRILSRTRYTFSKIYS